jgi:hypothetical protein
VRGGYRSMAVSSAVTHLNVNREAGFFYVAS